MSKKKSKSYVQMKEKNNKTIEHDIFNKNNGLISFRCYATTQLPRYFFRVLSNVSDIIIRRTKKVNYIEPPKKFPIKKFLLIFFCIIIIILIIIFFALIDKKTAEIGNKNSSNNTEQNKTTTTTTTTTKTTTNKPQIEEKSNQSLVCHTTTVDGDLELTTQVTANFYDNQLKSDINYMSVKLTNENSRELFDNYVITLQMFAIYLSDDETYEVSESTTDNEFILSKSIR